MASSTHADSSPYYPPRAGWASPLLGIIDRIRRRLGLDAILFPQGINTGAMVLGFFIPGLAVYFRWPGLIGRAALIFAGFLLLTFMIELGRPAGSLAFGMLLSMHTTGFVTYCTPLFGASLPRRLLLTVLTGVALGLLVYMPARTLLQRKMLMPLQVRGQVVIVHPIFSPGTIRSGDWIAYNISNNHDREEGGVYILAGIGFHPGLSLGPVLAMAGDRVEFSKTTFSVNGVMHPKLPHMPLIGGLIVPPMRWFIWPDMMVSEHGNVANAAISSTLLSMALVRKEQLAGQPFQRWFWHRQILP